MKEQDQETRTMKCVRRGCNNGGLDTKYITMWIVHYFTPINYTLFITMKVAEFTQTKPTSFKHGILGNF
jgi:hypothetical protein